MRHRLDGCKLMGPALLTTSRNGPSIGPNMKARVLGSALVALALGVGAHGPGPVVSAPHARRTSGSAGLLVSRIGHAARTSEGVRRQRVLHGRRSRSIRAQHRRAPRRRPRRPRPRVARLRKHVGADRRTSLIIDPPDGRVPPLTPAARAKVAARRARIQSGPADNPEDRPVQERCLVFGAGRRCCRVRTTTTCRSCRRPGAVVVLSEMIHDARIVALDGRPQPPAAMRFWLGSSRGHWDGDTLTRRDDELRGGRQLPRIRRTAARRRALHARWAGRVAHANSRSTTRRRSRGRGRARSP